MEPGQGKEERDKEEGAKKKERRGTMTKLRRGMIMKDIQGCDQALLRLM